MLCDGDVSVALRGIALTIKASVNYRDEQHM
jgi:hypothetical protein